MSDTLLDTQFYTRFLVSLVFVLGLIGLFAYLLRRLGPIGGRKFGRGIRRLDLVEVASIDARRRLILVRRDDVEHLVLIGGGNDLLIESGIERPLPPEPTFAAHLESPRL